MSSSLFKLLNVVVEKVGGDASCRNFTSNVAFGVLQKFSKVFHYDKLRQVVVFIHL